MESANIAPPRINRLPKGGSLPRSAPPTTSASSLWITTSTIIFDSEWRISYSSHTENASPTIQAIRSEGRDLLEVLGELSPQVMNLEKGAITSAFEPFSSQFGVWDKNSFRNYRLHIFANTEGGLCRLETRIPQPERIPLQGSPTHTDKEAQSLDHSLVPKTTHEWIHAIDELWPAVAFVQAPDFSLLTASESLFHFTGRSPQEFNTDPNLFWSVIHDSDRERIKQAPQNPPTKQETTTNRFRIRHLDSGQVRYVMEYRRAIQGGINECVWIDVSRETIAEKRLSSAAWKETLGILTVGLAHDFSNILSGIISLSESFVLQIQKEGSLSSDSEVGLKLIQSNAQQATQLVQRIVHLHKGEAVERTYQDLNAVVSEVSQLINKVLPRHIEVQLQRDTEELPIYVDIVELRQVLINLALNAADAMPLGGWIRLSTRRVSELPLFHQLVGTIPPSSIIAVDVCDCGHGISPSHLETIFDPFFTTKFHNKGSGLGLYNSRRFIEKQGGAIGVNTKLNEGTTFSILMPEATFTEAEKEFEVEQMKQHVVIAGECHEEIRAINETLKDYEFQIVTSQFEDDVLEQIELSYRNQVGVVLLANSQTDSTLTLVPRIKRSFPKAKILLVISGCNPDEIPTNITRQADRSICSNVPQSELAHALSEIFRE